MSLKICRTSDLQKNCWNLTTFRFRFKLCHKPKKQTNWWWRSNWLWFRRRQEFLEVLVCVRLLLWDLHARMLRLVLRLLTLLTISQFQLSSAPMQTRLTAHTPGPLPSSRHHLSFDDCLEDKKGNYQNCFVLCMTVVHNGMHIHMSSS